MSRSRALLARHGVDVVVVALAFAAGTAVLTRSGPGVPDGARLVLEAVAVAALILLLTLRRRAPFLAPAATWLGCAALSFADGTLVVGQAGISIAGMVAAVLLGSLRNQRQARAGLVVVVVGAAAVVVNDPTATTGDVLIPVLFAVGWLIGLALHERTVARVAAEDRAARAEREREAAARLAVAEERARIARELHDVVAHALSVMVLQVGAVRHRMPVEQERERHALAAVEAAGRGALTEMRHLLDAMRGDDDAAELVPPPGLDALGRLLDDVRATGLDVAHEVRGRPVALPAGVDLSVYRIVQEGLTNVLRHAQAAHARVLIRYGEDEVDIEVRDDGSGPTASSGLGHGLVGVAERVKIYGGTMTADAGEAGGFTLHARLPLARTSP